MEELDFLKCVMIVLMVVFHLAYFGDLHPHAKQFVYTFHMPAFLVISGYLLSASKEGRAFCRSTWWLFLPYAVMEACYAAASTMMPVRGGLEELSLGSMLDAITLHPVGPYWYLHTLILCDIVCYIAKRTGSVLTTVITAALTFWVLDYFAGVIAFGNASYFLIGFALRQSGISFTSFVRPSLLAILPLALLFALPQSGDFLKAFSLQGMATTYLMCSLLLYIFAQFPSRAKSPMLFIGASTLPILLFSPIFTMAAKALIPLFAFDPTGMLFMITATSITVAGSLAMAKVMDVTGMSPWFCGKRFL